MASTDYRISSLAGAELFNFNNAATGVAVGMHPQMENSQTMVVGESVDYRFANTNSFYYSGLRPRSFVIRGALIDDATNYNQYRLSSIVGNKAIVKVYPGQNWWFYYAIMTEATFIRQDTQPNVWSYQCSFTAFDPFMYNGNTGGTASGDYDTVTGTQSISGSVIDINLSTAPSSSYIEPFFIIKGGTTTNIPTANYIRFVDQYGRTAQMKPPVAITQDVQIIMCPMYFGEGKEVYVPQLASCYRTLATVTGATWIPDIDCYDNTKFTHASSALVITFATLTVTDTSPTAIMPKWQQCWPRAIPYTAGGAGNNRITVSSDATIGNAVITAQYLHRRI